MKRKTCKGCKVTCCEGWLSNRLFKDVKTVTLPKKIKEIDIDGIQLKRISKTRWRCKWYNPKTRKCKHYDLRPIICRTWFCGKHEEESEPTRNTSLYNLTFDLTEPNAK